MSQAGSRHGSPSRGRSPVCQTTVPTDTTFSAGNQDLINIIATAVTAAMNMRGGATHHRKNDYISKPSEFDGKREHYEEFNQSVQVWINGNPALVKDSEKIYSILSFMKGGDAAIFVQNYLQENQTKLDKDEITWTDFKELLDSQC